MRGGYRQFCAIARTLDVVGQRWTLLVVRELVLRGPLSAAAIARGLPEVPMNQLTERLALLEARGLVRAAEAPEGGRAWELTEEGRELEPVLGALARFGLERLAAGPAQEEAVLPHVLMRQLELRYDARRAAAEGFAGRFELVLRDPEALWSVEPGHPAPERWSLMARPGGLHVRAGACLEPDAVLAASVAACAALVAGEPGAGLGIEVSGDRVLAGRLLSLLGSPAQEAAAAA
jgi:DNA-binding HxlR family transcriptional regulator